MTAIRSKLGVIFIFILIAVLSVIKAAPAVSREPLRAALQATGAHIEDYSINAWAKLPAGQVSDRQLQKIVEEALEQLGIGVGDYQVVHQQRGTHRTVRAESISREFHVLAIAQVIPSVQSSESETYLVVNVESAGEIHPSIIEMKQKICNFIQKNGGSPKISTCLIGWLDGKLRVGERNEILQKAFMAIEGTIIDKLELDHFVSYTGFSSDIEDWLQVDGRRVNLNMVIRYSQYEDRTYIMIGSPIITREY